MKKAVKVLTTAALLASLATPFAAPAYAATDYRIGEVPTFSDDQETAPLAKLSFKEDEDYNTDLTPGGTITLTFPSGAKLKSNVEDFVTLNGTKVSTLPGGSVTKAGDYTLNIKLPTAAAFNANGVDTLDISPVVELDNFEGSSVDVKVESFGAGVPAGTYTLAKVSSGDTTTAVLDSKTIGEAGGTAGTIRIEETAANTIGDGTITLKLPNGFTWNETATNVSVIGGLNGSATVTKAGGNGTRTLTLNVDKTASVSTRGAIQIEAVVNVDTKEAKTGDIEVDVDGTDVDNQTVVLGKYSDYAVKVSTDGDPKQIIAGRVEDDDDIKAQKIIIKEDVAGSIIPGRKVKIELPDWVEVKKVDVNKETGLQTGKSVEDDLTLDENEVEFSIPASSTSKAEVQLTLYTSVQSNKSGDITAKISGRAGVEGEVVIAKAIAPVSAKVETATPVKVGLKDQPIGDITITENVKGAFLDNKQVRVELPDDIEWSADPKVEVIGGNLEIDEDSIDTDDNVLTFDIDGESTQASTIKISGGKVDINRSVPEGSIDASIKGTALVENSDAQRPKDAQGNPTTSQGYFDSTKVASVTVANVVTPAPSDVTASNIVFKLNSKTYTVDGKEQQMDAAPLVGWDRAYLPVRFAANALSVSDSNIIWDDKTSTFTIFKGDRVITGKVGDKFLTVNGVKVPMDVPVWRNKAQTNDRVMVPIRYLANALNAKIEWNKETSEITIQSASK